MHRKLLLTWAGIAVASWAVYEITKVPSLVPVLAGLWVAADDLRTAWWIQRRDRDLFRGFCLFWAYAAWALLKGTAAALMLVNVAALAHLALNAARGLPWGMGELMAGWGRVFLVGGALTAVAAHLAFWPAYLRGRRLWLNSGLGHDRQGDAWPPREPGPVNWLPQAMTLAAAQTLICGVPLALLFFVAVYERHGGRVALPVFLALLAGGIALVVYLEKSGRLNRFATNALDTVTAESPQECWGQPAERAAALNPPEPPAREGLAGDYSRFRQEVVSGRSAR
jgi:hypothetical protein